LVGGSEASLGALLATVVGAPWLDVLSRLPARRWFGHGMAPQIARQRTSVRVASISSMPSA
jgi:hypothetical protein